MAKSKNSLAQLMNYAGGHKKLTILGCTLSGVAAVLAMGPFICIWLVIREIFPDPVQEADRVLFCARKDHVADDDAAVQH